MSRQGLQFVVGRNLHSNAVEQYSTARRACQLSVRRCMSGSGTMLNGDTNILNGAYMAARCPETMPSRLWHSKEQ